MANKFEKYSTGCRYIGRSQRLELLDLSTAARLSMLLRYVFHSEACFSLLTFKSFADHHENERLH